MGKRSRRPGLAADPAADRVVVAPRVAACSLFVLAPAVALAVPPVRYYVTFLLLLTHPVAVGWRAVRLRRHGLPDGDDHAHDR